MFFVIKELPTWKFQTFQPISQILGKVDTERKQNRQAKKKPPIPKTSQSR
jgi:hypothetical protein